MSTWKDAKGRTVDPATMTDAALRRAAIRYADELKRLTTFFDTKECYKADDNTWVSRIEREDIVRTRFNAIQEERGRRVNASNPDTSAL